MRTMMLGTTTMLALGGAMLAGCAMTPSTGTPIAIERETISYQTSPCYGTCPVYAITVQPDGTGMFEGKQHTAVTGTRAFKATPAQVRAFTAKLAPYRPASGDRMLQPGQPGCENAPTDMPSVEVRWNEMSGASQALSYYYGCGAADNGATGNALRAAPAELPVADLIGKR